MDPQADAADPVVFCSYSRVDEEVVKAFAARLRSDGIDAWFDRWEIQPGDDFVAKIDDVLRRYATALVFLSSTQGQTGRWAGVERRSLTVAQVEWVEGRGRRVIPVLVDEGAEIPPLLLRLDHRPVTEYEAIRDAILGISAKPPLGPRYLADPSDGPPPIVGVSGAGPASNEKAVVGAIGTTSPEAEPAVSLPPVTDVRVSGTPVSAPEARSPVSGVAVIESPTPAARRRRRWIVAGAVPLILVLALVGVLVADRLTGSTSENPPGAHRSGGDADGGGGSGLGDDGAQAGAGSSTTERGGGSGPDGTGTPGTTQNGGGGDLGDEPSMTRPGGDPPITLPPVVPTDPPSCPSMPTTASVDDASSSHGVRPTMASYELHPGKWMSLGREGAITGHLDDGSLEIRLFRNEVPGTQSSSEPVASGRADHYYMGPPLMLDGNGCWKESVKPFISYSCASGLDFRYHVAVVDKAEASRLAGISNSNGIDKDEIEGNPKMTFIGEFEVPTPYIPNCPALPG